MSKGYKLKENKTMSKNSKVLIGLVFLSLCLFFALIVMAVKDDKTSKLKEAQPISIIGEYSVDGGDWKQLGDSQSLFNRSVESVRIRGHFQRDVEKNVLLIFRIHNIKAQMRVNGETLFIFGEEPTNKSLYTYPGSYFGFYVSPGIEVDDEIEFELESFNSKYSDKRLYIFLENIQTGYGYEVYDAFFSENGIDVLIGIIIMLISIVLPFQLSIYYNHVNFKRGLVFSFFAFVGGIYYITDGAFYYLPLIIPNPVLVNIVDVGSLILIIPSYCLYFYMNLERRLTRTIMFCVCASSVFGAAFCFLLQMLNLVDIYDLQGIMMIPALLGMICGMVCLCYEGLRLKSVDAMFTIAAFLPLMAAIILETINIRFFPFMPTRIAVRLAVVVTIFMHTYQLVRHMKKLAAQEMRTQQIEKELAEQKIAILLSQIQPHFLFNSLIAIQELCKIDSNRAEAAVRDFSMYLRVNLDSLNSTRPISFEKELEHVGHYLSIEQIRFEDRLNVVYDTPVTSFQVPSLIVQPVVENAVRYGITKNEDGGRITISTLETEGEYIITVSDDGKGFDVALPPICQDDSRSHTGLENVKSRLEAQCGGTLTIESVDSVGTTVTISIPRTCEWTLKQ